MAQPITWKRMSTDVGGATAGLADAQTALSGSVNRGIGGLQKILADRITGIKARDAKLTDMNTKNVLRKLQGVQSLSDYNANAGAYSNENVSRVLGDQVDLDAVQAARDSKLNTLRSDAIAQLTNQALTGVGTTADSVTQASNKFMELGKGMGISEVELAKSKPTFDKAANDAKALARSNKTYNQTFTDYDNTLYQEQLGTYKQNEDAALAPLEASVNEAQNRLQTVNYINKPFHDQVEAAGGIMQYIGKETEFRDSDFESVRQDMLNGKGAFTGMNLTPQATERIMTEAFNQTRSKHDNFGTGGFAEGVFTRAAKNLANKDTAYAKALTDYNEKQTAYDKETLKSKARLADYSIKTKKHMYEAKRDGNDYDFGSIATTIEKPKGKVDSYTDLKGGDEPTIISNQANIDQLHTTKEAAKQKLIEAQNKTEPTAQSDMQRNPWGELARITKQTVTAPLIAQKEFTNKRRRSNITKGLETLDAKSSRADQARFRNAITDEAQDSKDPVRYLQELLIRNPSPTAQSIINKILRDAGTIR